MNEEQATSAFLESRAEVGAFIRRETAGNGDLVWFRPQAVQSGQTQLFVGVYMCASLARDMLGRNIGESEVQQLAAVADHVRGLAIGALRQDSSSDETWSDRVEEDARPLFTDLAPNYTGRIRFIAVRPTAGSSRQLFFVAICKRLNVETTQRRTARLTLTVRGAGRTTGDDVPFLHPFGKLMRQGNEVGDVTFLMLDTREPGSDRMDSISVAASVVRTPGDRTLVFPTCLPASSGLMAHGEDVPDGLRLDHVTLEDNLAWHARFLDGEGNRVEPFTVRTNQRLSECGEGVWPWLSFAFSNTHDLYHVAEENHYEVQLPAGDFDRRLQHVQNGLEAANWHRMNVGPDPAGSSFWLVTFYVAEPGSGLPELVANLGDVADVEGEGPTTVQTARIPGACGARDLVVSAGRLTGVLRSSPALLGLSGELPAEEPA